MNVAVNAHALPAEPAGLSVFAVASLIVALSRLIRAIRSLTRRYASTTTHSKICRLAASGTASETTQARRPQNGAVRDAQKNALLSAGQEGGSPNRIAAFR